MPRAHTKSKAGCQRCRSRRKKCNEVKPVCGACLRWDFPCIWPQVSANTTSSGDPTGRSLDNACILVPRSITGHGFPPFRDQAQLDLLRQFSGVYRGLISPLAGREYRDLSPLVSMSLRTAWVRDALNVFTEYMMMSVTAPGTKKVESVLSNYQLVVTSLRNRLSGPLQAGEQFSVLVAVTFLGIYESFGTGEAELVMAHFATVAVLFREVLLQSSSRLVTPMHRMIFEILLYNLASHSMFCPVPEAASSAVGWMLRQYHLTQYEKMRGPAYSHSPHLGGNFEFHSLILRITDFSRHQHDHEHRAHQVDAWLSELDHLDRRLGHYYAGAPRTTADQLKAKHQLYSLALRIYCLKVKDHELLSSSPEVNILVYEAMKLCEQGHLNGIHAAAVSWPLLIILRACANHATFSFFAVQIENMETTFDRGHLRRLQTVVAKLRHKHMEYENCAEHVNQDNFKSLIHKLGLTASYC